MIIFDTNVLSELMRIDPSPKVLDWAERFARAEVYTTVISQAEIASGIAMMPEGKRRAGLDAAARRMFTEDFSGRILPFGEDAVPHYAQAIADRRRSGRSWAPLDMMIAAIALSYGAMVATRDTGDFQDCGIDTHNPWAEE